MKQPMGGKGIDVVYTVGKGSGWNDNELKYSLRGVQQHLTGVRNIVIVGHMPAWLNPATVMHINVQDGQQHREKNICDKILAACAHRDISDEFLFMNDDHFFLEPNHAPDYPFYDKGYLLGAVMKRDKNCSYRASLYNTYLQLRQNQRSTRHFDIHTPIRYDKKAFAKVMAKVDWYLPGAFVIKSLYANQTRKESVFMVDCKIDEPLTLKEIKQKVAGRHIFSIGDRGLTPGMSKFLATTYPTPSRFELP